jgi:hypothetical protein
MAEYDPPIYDVSIFNPAYFLVEDGITKSYLNANYLQFPVGQGLETLPDLRVDNQDIHLGTGSVSANRSVAIGNGATTATATTSVAIGNGCEAEGSDCIAIGENANSGGFVFNSIAIGNNTTCSSSNQLRIGTNNTAYQMEGRLNLVNSTNKSLISFGNAVKMYRYNNGLTIGNYGDFNIRVSDFTAEPTSVPSSQSGFEGLWITSTGRAYLGSGLSVHLRSVLGEVYITGYTTAGNVSTIGTSGQLSVSSDRRLKENIETYDEPSIDKIMKLKPSYYNWIKGTDKRKELGFIAQDVEDIIPEAVDGKKYEFEWEKDKEGNPILDENGNLQFTDTPRYRGLLDRPIIAVLVKAVQELKMEIEALKNQ